MRINSEIEIKNLANFKKQVLLKSKEYSVSCILDSSGVQTPLNLDKYEFLAALGCSEKIESKNNSFEELERFQKEQKDWIFGALSYDIKNELGLNDLHELPLSISFPKLFFFKPITVIYVLRESPEKATVLTLEPPFDLDFLNISATELLNVAGGSMSKPTFKSNFTKNEYIQTVEEIREKIEEGLYYELNLCQEFTAQNISINPTSVYQKMVESNPVPFGAYFAFDQKYILCSSPERFLSKDGMKITSQPIKGTARRGSSPKEDDMLKYGLKKSAKERAENVMIVDLVRNDLSQSCNIGTVNVDELFGIHSYSYVHQMISTISGELRNSSDAITCLKKAFPMGSMTGAPKMEVIKNINKLEQSARGMYSGSIGYIDPKGDFDFNVVIRTLIYDEAKYRLSYHVGGAITYDSNPEQEYEECLLKAKGITSLFN